MDETLVMEHEEEANEGALVAAEDSCDDLDLESAGSAIVPVGEMTPAEIAEVATAVLPAGSEEAQWDRIMRFAQFAAATGLYGEETEWDLAMKGLVGMGLGLHAATSFQELLCIKNKTGKSIGIRIPAKLQRALAGRAGYVIKKAELTDKVCTLQLFAPTGELIGEETYTWEDAGRAKLLGNEVWSKHPKRMLLARCSDHLISTYCAHVLFFKYGNPI